MLCRIPAGFPNLDHLTIFDSTLAARLAARSFAVLLPGSFGPSARRLEVIGKRGELLGASTGAALIQSFPNLKELQCHWVDYGSTGDFLRAVQSLRSLEPLSLGFVAAVDADFASSTGWVQPLRKILIYQHSALSPNKVLHCLSNFTATLTDLTLELRGPFSLSAPPILLHHLRNCYLYLPTLADIAHGLRLAEAPIQRLRVTELGGPRED